MPKKKKGKVFLNYNVKFKYPEIQEFEGRPINQNIPPIVTLFKYTNNPEYIFEMDFELIKIGAVYFIKTIADNGKIASSRTWADSFLEKGLRTVFYSPFKFYKRLSEVMRDDATECIKYAVKKAAKAKGIKRGRGLKKPISLTRLKRKSYALIDRICKENNLWKEAFSNKNQIFSSLFSIFLHREYHQQEYKAEDIERSKKFTEKLESVCFFKDYDNIYCFRKYLEIFFKYSPRMTHVDSYPIFLSLLKGWESILETNNSKRRTIGTWPNIVSGIFNLPKVKFNRHVTNKLEIRSHLSFAGIIGFGAAGFGRAHPIGHKIEEVVQKAPNTEIKRAYKCFRLHRRMTGRISYGRMKEMYQHINDSIRISVQRQCSDEMQIEFQQGILNCKSLKRIVELSNLIHRDHAVQMVRKDIKGRNVGIFAYPTINPNFEKDGATVTFLDNSEDVYLEGKQMHHCVGGYARDAYSRKYLLFHISYKGEDATLSLVKRNGLYSIGQCYGPWNRPNKASEKARDLLSAWAGRYNAWVKRTPQDIVNQIKEEVEDRLDRQFLEGFGGMELDNELENAIGM